MKWLVRILFLFLCIVGCLAAMPEVRVGSGDKVSSSVRYVALGDSIAHGYGLRNPEKDSYVGQVTQYLESGYDYVVTTNFGTDGMESEDLLDALTNEENENYRRYRATLKYADIVSLSIGSNDLMHLVKLNVNIQKYIENGDLIFREACEEFNANFRKIIQEINALAPQADIYANNVYNPAKGLPSYKKLYNPAEKYINLLNEAFLDTPGFTLVDIKKGFDNSNEKLVNMAWKGTQIDPHPSKEGHQLIGELVIWKLKESGF